MVHSLPRTAAGLWISAKQLSTSYYFSPKYLQLTAAHAWGRLIIRTLGRELPVR